jgi:predicted DNA-binding protein YlxM (UPF0122 family)
MSATIEKDKLKELDMLLEQLLSKLEDLNKYELQLFNAWKDYRFKEALDPYSLNAQEIKDCIKVADKLLGKTEKDFL